MKMNGQKQEELSLRHNSQKIYHHKMLFNTFLVRNNCKWQPYNHKVLQSSNLGGMHRHTCETITHLSGLLD